MVVSPRDVRWPLRNVPVLAVDRRHRREHGGDDLVVSPDDRGDIARAYGQRASGSDDSSTRDHPIALSRRKKVHLVFDRQHRCARRHQRHCRVSARNVDDRREHGAGEVPVMLREIVSKRQVDLDLTGSDTVKSRADGSHQREIVEAPTYTRLEVAVLDSERGHRSLLVNSCGWLPYRRHHREPQTGADEEDAQDTPDAIAPRHHLLYYHSHPAPAHLTDIHSSTYARQR